MARMTKERLAEKIRIAEEKVARTGRIYNAACEELQELRNKMTAIDRLWGTPHSSVGFHIAIVSMENSYQTIASVIVRLSICTL